MAINHDTPRSAHRQAWDRRAAHAARIAALLVGIFTIVVFINVISVRNVNRFGDTLRFDWTATRQYSLSDQTQQVLRNLESPVHITTIFASEGRLDPDTARNIRLFRELIDEYTLRSAGNVRSQHIRAGDVVAVDAFAAKITQRYQQPIDQGRAAFDAARAAVTAFDRLCKSQAPRFRDAAATLGSTDPGLRKQLAAFSDRLLSQQTEYNPQTLDTLLNQHLDTTFPDYATAQQQTVEDLTSLRDQYFTAILDTFKAEAEADDNRPALKRFYAESLDAFRQTQQHFDTALDQLQAIDFREYDRFRAALLTGDAAVITTDDRLTVISLSNAYANAYDYAASQRFRGEEAVTNAIISLTLARPPHIVFVNAARQPAIGPRGSLSHVARRLENMSFTVSEWNPVGRVTPAGVSRPDPRPAPEPGQTIVWVHLAPPPLNPMAPSMTGQLQVADSIRKTLETNHPTLILLPQSILPQFRQPDPIAQAVAPLGINAETDKLILTEFVDPAGNAQPMADIRVTDWPDDHPIGRALAGQIATLKLALPLTWTQSPDRNFAPLMQTKPNTWAEKNWAPNAAPYKRNADEPRGPFTVAAAIESPRQRAVLIGDELFAADSVILSPATVQTSQGPRTVNIVTNPANAELFINSIYWLASLDPLIASGARTQQLPYIQDIDPTAHTTANLILTLGLPALTLFIGINIYLVRRK